MRAYTVTWKCLIALSNSAALACLLLLASLASAFSMCAIAMLLLQIPTPC